MSRKELEELILVVFALNEGNLQVQGSSHVDEKPTTYLELTD